MSPTAQGLFEAAIPELIAEGLELQPTRMFGSDGIKVAGKTAAMIVRGALVLKLPAARTDQLIADGFGRRFDPGHGRPMREWIELQPGDIETTLSYMREAAAFAGENR